MYVAAVQCTEFRFTEVSCILYLTRVHDTLSYCKDNIRALTYVALLKEGKNCKRVSCVVHYKRINITRARASHQKHVSNKNTEGFSIPVSTKLYSWSRSLLGQSRFRLCPHRYFSINSESRLCNPGTGLTFQVQPHSRRRRLSFKI